MKKKRDIRLRALAITAVVVTILAVLIQHLPIHQQEVTPVNTTFDTSQHARQQKQTEIDERFQQAVLMLHAEQYDYAVTALHRVLELAPNMPEAHVNMGFALLGSGNFKAAHDFFQSAIALRPSQSNAYWGLAVSLEALCDIEGAKGAMRTFVHLGDPDNKFMARAKAALWEWETMQTNTSQELSNQISGNPLCQSQTPSQG